MPNFVKIKYDNFLSKKNKFKQRHLISFQLKCILTSIKSQYFIVLLITKSLFIICII